MPPYLHPKSRSTISLFGITLFASLFVVGLPHLFPCPTQRRILADSEIMITADGHRVQRIRRIRRKDANTLEQDDRMAQGPSPPTDDDEVQTFLQLQEEAERWVDVRRECPVPKPPGRLGELLGFTSRGHEQQQQLGRAEFPRSGAPGLERWE